MGRYGALDGVIANCPEVGPTAVVCAGISAQPSRLGAACASAAERTASMEAAASTGRTCRARTLSRVIENLLEWECLCKARECLERDSAGKDGGANAPRQFAATSAPPVEPNPRALCAPPPRTP